MKTVRETGLEPALRFRNQNLNRESSDEEREHGRSTSLVSAALSRSSRGKTGAPRGARNGKYKHGRARTPEWKAWKNARYRCTHPSSPDWPNYGGRGVTMCAAWRDSFAAFLAHIGPKPSPELTLERIDNDRGYEPGNVRWATRREQNLNKRA